MLLLSDLCPNIDETGRRCLRLSGHAGLCRSFDRMWPGSVTEDRDLKAELALAEDEVASLTKRLEAADRTENELRGKIARLREVIETVSDLKD